MQTPAYSLLLLSLLAVGSCKSSPAKPEPAPKPAVVPLTGGNDELARAHGYWEWLQNVRMSGTITPTETGFTRQLIFKADGHLDIYHNRQLVLKPSFALRTGLTHICVSPVAQPLVEYTAEPQVPNDPLRRYRLNFSATDTTLTITGESNCVDGGAVEYYRWHHL
ncbi:hypothetical protein [Hymenobacter daeguensis]